VVAIPSTIAGSQFNILSNLNGFPRVPINEGTLTAGGIITAITTTAGSTSRPPGLTANPNLHHHHPNP
jgi:hypothetical protein